MKYDQISETYPKMSFQLHLSAEICRFKVGNVQFAKTSDNAGNSSFKGLPPARDTGTLSFLIFGPDFPFFTQISSFWFNHNVFQTQYFFLKFSGSLKQFLKRSFPVCLVQKHPENLNISENFTVSKIDDPKFYLVHPPDIFSQKDPGFVRFRSILNDPQNLSKKY